MNMHNNYTEQWKNQTIERGMYCTVSIIYGVYTFTWGLSKVPYSINQLTGLLKQLMFFKVLNRVTSADFVPLKGFAVQGEYVPAKFSLLVKWKMITMCRMILGDIHSLKSKWTSKQKNTAKQTKKLFFFFFPGKKKKAEKEASNQNNRLFHWTSPESNFLLSSRGIVVNYKNKDYATVQKVWARIYCLLNVQDHPYRRF